MEALLNGLRAAGETTRLRILALCARGELTVTELTQILGQSQPRVSRHLKLLCDAGLLERLREGTWAFYRLAEEGACGELGRTLIALLPADDAALGQDLQRLQAVKRARADEANAYFRANASCWNEIRSLHVPEAEVEAALLALFADRAIDSFLDIGTGTGRMLQLFADQIRRGIGVDLSHDMLAVARASLEDSGLHHCQVRHADMYRLPFADASLDAVTFHQVLHFADQPAAALAEGVRVLAPGGRLAVVDFAPHELEALRHDHAHRRLGFSDAEVAEWFRACGLELGPSVRLEGQPLTVVIWPGHIPGTSPAVAPPAWTEARP